MITKEDLKHNGWLHEPITDSYTKKGTWIILEDNKVTEISSGESKWLKILPVDNIGLLNIIIYVLFERE